MTRALTLNPADDVAVVLDSLEPGAVVESLGLRALEAIPAGHKIARHAIAAGSVVRKYGQVIGEAMIEIAAGAHVHTHNLAMSDARAGPAIGVDAQAPKTLSGATFEGFVRADGTVGTRNYIGVLTSVNCSATVARRIADAFPDETLPDGVDGVVAFTHQGGCGGSSLSADTIVLQRTMAGYARHPNFAAVLVVGLGCEANQIPDWLAREGL
ncbi:MAG: hypothetical protein RL093_1457, partial [Pseudomonadota bacterium]